MSEWQSSSFCDTGQCVEVQWQKSSFCDTGGCVEVMQPVAGSIMVRDSKDPDGPMLTFNTDEWTAFVTGVRSGEFDL